MASASSEVVYLKVDEIEVPEERVTSYMDDETLAELRESIKEKGILQPLLVAKVNDRYVLIDGLHRLAVAKDLGMERVPCVVKEMDERELMITNFIVNRQRGRSNPADEARMVVKLVSEFKMSLDEVASALNISRRTAERYYRIGVGCREECMKALETGQLSVSCAEWIASVGDPEIQARLVKDAVEWRYTVDQCRSAVLHATIPNYEPEPGGWTFVPETGQPIRRKVVSPLCNIEDDPSRMASIVVPVDYYETVLRLLSDEEFCRALLAPSQQSGAQILAPSQQQTEVQPPARERRYRWEW